MTARQEIVMRVLPSAKDAQFENPGLDSQTAYNVTYKALRDEMICETVKMKSRYLSTANFFADTEKHTRDLEQLLQKRIKDLK